MIGARDVFAVTVGGSAHQVRCVPCGATATIPASTGSALLVHVDACEVGELMRGSTKPCCLRAGAFAVEVFHETRSRLA